MKSVLISIQPKWCELICKCIGWDNQKPQYKKRLELRKTAPKPPFKAYIYCTKSRKPYESFAVSGKPFECGGKVIGEFICNYVLDHCEMSNADMAELMSCVKREDILKYAKGKNVRGWHIDNLVIYDEPKELGEFHTLKKCNSCKSGYESTACIYDENCIVSSQITRPPQSWCYVVRKEDEGK